MDLDDARRRMKEKGSTAWTKVKKELGLKTMAWEVHRIRERAPGQSYWDGYVGSGSVHRVTRDGYNTP